jgi:hypothetical protein
MDLLILIVLFREQLGLEEKFILLESIDYRFEI